MSSQRAFPDPYRASGVQSANPGMSYREYLIAHCPIPFGLASELFGDDWSRTSVNVAAVMAIHAKLCRDWADEVIAQLDQHDKDKRI